MFHPTGVGLKSPRNFTSKVVIKGYEQMKMAASKMGAQRAGNRKQYLNVTGMFSTRNRVDFS